MHLAPNDVFQQTHLAFTRHQQLLSDAQQRRMIKQVAPGQALTRPQRMAAWRRWLGKQFITWGEALRGPVYSGSATPHRAKS